MEIKTVKPQIWNFEVVGGKNSWREVAYSARVSGVPPVVRDEDIFKMIVRNDYGSALEHVLIKFDLKMTKGNACVKGDTMVFGNNVEITAIKPGNLVLSKDGKEQKILATSSREYTGEIVNLDVLGLPTLSLTPDHPVLTAHFRRVHRKSKRSHGENVYEWTYELEWKPAGRLNPKEYVVVPRSKSSQPVFLNLRKGIHRKLTHRMVNRNIAWLLGVWTAGGCTSGNNVIFTLGSSETELANKILEVAANELGIHGTLFKRPGLSKLYLKLYDQDLARFLRDNFGTRATNKHIPNFMKFAPHDALRMFMDGILRGSGNLSTSSKGSKNLRIVTSSKKLAYDLMEVLYKLGIAPSLYDQEPKEMIVKGRRYSCKRSYVIRFSKRKWDREPCKNDKQPYSRAKSNSDYIFLPIKKITKSWESTKVYNLQTEDNTFCIPFIVHNCEFLEHRMISHTGYSTRYIKADEGVEKEKPVYEVIMPWHLLKLKREDQIRQEFWKSISQGIETYEKLLEKGVPMESARYALPFCQAVGIYHVTMNLRSLLNLLGLRLCVRASPEFRCIAAQIYFGLLQQLPIMRGLVGCRGFMRGICPEGGVTGVRKGKQHPYYPPCPFKNPKTKIFIPVQEEVGKAESPFDVSKAVEVQERIFKEWAAWEG